MSAKVTTTDPETASTYSDELPEYLPAPQGHPPLPTYHATVSPPVEGVASPNTNSNTPECAPPYAPPRRSKSRELTEAERLQMLAEFQAEKLSAPDYWGGLKGSAEGPPKDPFKLFRWAGRKLSHDEDPSKRPEGSKERWYDRSRSEVEWAKDGEVAKGDIDSSTVM